MPGKKLSKVKVSTRIVEYVAKNNGAVSVGMAAADLRLALTTAQRQIASLIDAGRLEYAWDGAALCLTDSEIKDRAQDASIRAMFGRKTS